MGTNGGWVKKVAAAFLVIMDLVPDLKVLLGGELLGLELALDVAQPEFSEDAADLHPVLHVHLQLFQRLKVLL